MPKLDLRNATRIKTAGGELAALKGAGFSWVKPQDISASLSLPIGQEGVIAGFSALPEVISYTATEGRYRRGPNGFVRCAANEERLCFDSAGRFIGQAMEGPETYSSAPWDVPSPNGTGDFAFLNNGSGTRIRYAGQHSEPDIFGGTGGGVVITNEITNQIHVANNVQVTADRDTLLIDQVGHDDGIVSWRLRGGANGEDYILTCQITSTSGLIDERSVRYPVRQR